MQTTKLSVLAVAVIVAVGCTSEVDLPTPPAPPPARELSEAPQPRSLEEALTTLQQRMPGDILVEFLRSSDENVTSHYHHSLGMWIRNNWGLWERGPLYRDLEKRGLKHPDDMSGVILTSLWRRLHDQPLRIEEQISSYQEFWRDVRAAPGHSRTDPNPRFERPGR